MEYGVKLIVVQTRYGLGQYNRLKTLVSQVLVSSTLHISCFKFVKSID